MVWMTWLADACRETGYPVVELPGWQTRGHGAMTGLHGVVGHWTAGPQQSASSGNTPSLTVVRDGRPGLDGPLCNVYTAFNGTLYVVAAGKAYHAGVSSWRGEDDLNGTYAGNEVESPGGFVYTEAQLDVAPRLHASILRHMGRSADYSTAHFEVADPPGRKPDGPASNMAGFRFTVGAYIADPSTIDRENDMAITDDDATKIANAVAVRLNPLGTDVKTIISRVGALMTALNQAGVDDAKRDAGVLTFLGTLPRADVDEQALAADLAPLLAQSGVNLDPATIAQAIRADFAAALAS